MNGTSCLINNNYTAITRVSFWRKFREIWYGQKRMIEYLEGSFEENFVHYLEFIRKYIEWIFLSWHFNFG